MQEMSYFEQTHPVNYPENEITSDSNIIPYSQYLLETQNAVVHDTNSSTQQDAMILSVFEQLSNQVTNSNKVNKDNLIANESLSAKLERYKERVKLLEERQNVDLRTGEKLIMDDIIREKNAQFTDFEKKINSLKQTLSEQLKEKELLTETFNVLKNESKEKETKNIDKEIALEKKVKELDNIVYKMGQSAQTVHMLTKAQVFYDNNLKQDHGFQNPFYLKKAQQIRPMLYDGSVIAKETNVISIADSEETLMLEEESRSKMLLKQSDLMVLEKKVNIKLINYAEFNRLSKDFGKRFVPQQELSDEQAFRLQTSHPNTNQSASSPVKIEAPPELPKVSLAYTSLKKLKYHLGQFDVVVKKRTTPDALTEGEWGKFKGNDIVDNAAQVSNATTVAPGMYKLDLITLAPKDKNNRETHIYYLKYTIEQAAILREIVEQAKSLNPLDRASYSALVTLRIILKSLSPNTKTRRPQPSSNTNNDKVSSASKSSCIKNNKVEVAEHHRKLLLSKNKNHMSSECNYIKLAIRNDKSKVICAMCKQCLITSNHDVCVLNYVNNKNSHADNQNANVSNVANKKKHKPKAKKLKKVGSKERLASSKPRKPKTCLSLTVLKVIEIYLWCVDSGCSKHMTGNLNLIINFVWKFLGNIRFGNDHVAAIM
ncbi:hypothetical protein Tco_0915949, partial [Tanacetum coccineum]